MSDQHRDAAATEINQFPAATEPESRKTWETPVLEELAVQLSAIRPGVGRDGGVADCSHS